jgi:hypothetical protein
MPVGLVRQRSPRVIRRSRRKPDLTSDFQYPRIEFDEAPISLYWYARSAAGMPLLQFLAFYQLRRRQQALNRRRDAGGALNYLGLTPKWVDGTRPGSPGRPARARRSRIVHDSCPPRGAATLGPLRDGADHAWRGRPLQRRATPAISWHLPASPAILTSRSKRTICAKFRSGARVWRGLRFPPCCPPVSRFRPPVRPLRPPANPVR